MSKALKREAAAGIPANKTPDDLPAMVCDALPDPVIVFDEAMNLRYTNPAAQEIFYPGVKGVAEATLARLFDRNAAVLDAAAGVLASGKTMTLHDARVHD